MADDMTDDEANYCSNVLAVANQTTQFVPATIVSSFLSIVGSLLIIATFVMWKDVRRSTARQILLFLAIADLMGAVGYFAGGVAFYMPFSEYVNGWICKIGSFWTTYFPVVSFFWTTYLAIYFAVALVLKRPNWTTKLMIPYHLTAWLIPLAICIGLIIPGWLGPGNNFCINQSNNGNYTEALSQVAVGWCFVSSKIFENITNESDIFQEKVRLYFVIEAVAGKGWEIISYFVVVVCYVLIVVFNRCCCCKQNDFTSSYPKSPENSLVEGASSFYAKQRVSKALASVDFKLMLVPVIFIFLRFWGTLRYFLFFSMECRQPVELKGNYWLEKNLNCTAYDKGLIFMQAFCDPLQGFGNAVLFVLMSRVLMHRLCSAFGGFFVRLYHYLTCCSLSPSSTNHYDVIEAEHTSVQSAKSEDGILRVTYSPGQKRKVIQVKGGLEKDDFSDSHHKLDYGSMQENSLKVKQGVQY